MDIRRFFSPGGKGPSKDSGSKASTKGPEKSKQAGDRSAPKKASVISVKKKISEKIQIREKKRTVVVIDSDSDEAPIKVKHKNTEEENGVRTTKEKQTKKDIKEKSKEKDVKETVKRQDRGNGKKDQEKASGSELSPGEKENKNKKQQSQKEKGSTRKSKNDQSPKPVKRKSRKLESDEEEEEFEVKLKTSRKDSKSRKGAIIFDSDSDEDPIPPTPRQDKPRSRRKKPMTFVSDSDEESQPSISAAFMKVVPKATLPATKITSPKVRAAVSATDFFGSSSVQRVVKRNASVKRKAETSPAKDIINIEEDIEIHDDVDFEKTLLNLDKEDHKAKKVKMEDSPSPTKGSPEKPKTPRGTPGSYRSYLQRAPPQALGSKEVPEGEPNCLEGLTFVISGVLESLERDDAKVLIERLGGKVTLSLSKKTSYFVVGRDAGASKTAKAADLGTKHLDEDGLFDLIKQMPGKRSKYEIQAEASIAKEKEQTPKQKKSPNVAQRSSPATRPGPSTPGAVSRLSSQGSSQASPAASPKVADASIDSTGLMWVDKYKPTSLKQVIGQQGPKSNANKLLNWIRHWHRWQAEGRKPAFGNRFSDDGAGFKAALLSGPPGIGKTTTATLVCKEAGFSYVELNASDTRSKKSLETVVTELLSNHTVVDYIGGSKNSGTEGKTHCLIMDEVDGMAGNEDRGGMQELIGLIKKSRIPIICLCNDRNSQKVRSLANYCFDLRFQRPRVEQIKAAMMSLTFKEGVKIPPPALNEVISAANQDIRQVIHNLSMWSVSSKAMDYDQVKRDATKATKDIKLGPFDVCRKVFVGGEETAHMTINDKSDLFFHDYSFAPLFVHENYIHAVPFAARGDKKKHLRCLSTAIDSIADGDLVDRFIRRDQRWNLLPTEAMFASVIPGEAMRGGFSHMVQFPQWLGKNSTTRKTDRILQDLRMHMSLRISGDKQGIALDYVPHLRRRLTSPLARQQQGGVPEVLNTVNSYDLLREDYDSLLEISQWSHLADPLASVDSKTKAAFTRAYNKEGHLTPYAAVATAKKGRGRGGGGGEDLMLEEGGEGSQAASDQESDDDMKADGMIKAKKKPAGRGRGQTKDTGSKGKGHGKGAGRGRGRGNKK